jgi:formylglycine-generating enzyme required for sulfatase activity
MTTQARFALLAVLTGASGSCADLPAAGEVVVHFEIDSPLVVDGPQANTSPPALFHRLRIEVLKKNADGVFEACASCSRDVAVSDENVRGDQISFGIVPSSEDVVVRARLFRLATGAAAQPRPSSTIDTWTRIPHVPEGDLVDLTIALRTDDVGQTSASAESPTEARVGLPRAAVTGSWPGARRVQCVGDPPTATSGCMPGGAFWMGNPLGAYAAVPGTEANLERLVVLSPFWVDFHETTVAELRAIGAPTPADLVRWNGKEPSVSEIPDDSRICTYSNQSSDRDDLPVNCIHKTAARAICQERDGGAWDLPSEAQMEYMLGNLRSQRYLSGEQEPSCDDAVGERGWAYFQSNDCLEPGEAPLPKSPGSEPGDHLSTAQGDVVDLMGNLSEYMADEWARQEEPCWGTAILQNPVCEEPSTIDDRHDVLRGGSWLGFFNQALSYSRGYVAGPTGARTLIAGFRCSRDASGEL